MKVELLYGRDGLTCDAPDDARVHLIEKPVFPSVADPEQQVAAAFDAPIGCPPLRELATGQSSACILICDITRLVPNGLFLRPMIEQMMASGTAKDRISVLVATGLHRRNEGAELAELVGEPCVLENVGVESHFAMNDDDHIDLEQTVGRGLPITLDKRFVEAGLRIATGLVERHFMASYSGERQVVAPGVPHHETIPTFHSARFMEDPTARECNLAANPLHEEQLEIICMLAAAISASIAKHGDPDVAIVPQRPFVVPLNRAA